MIRKLLIQKGVLTGSNKAVAVTPAPSRLGAQLGLAKGVHPFMGPLLGPPPISPSYFPLGAAPLRLGSHTGSPRVRPIKFLFS
jgi:hypothetical protein